MQPEKEYSAMPEIAEAAALYELSLQDAWNGVTPDSRLKAQGNRTVTVLSPGVWNFGSGPDFSHACIQVDGQTLKGAVEVHRLSGDWFRHGHHDDPAYDDVILHVVAENDLTPERLSELPLMLIMQNPSDDISREELVEVKNGRCASYFSALTRNQLRTMFVAAGMERFHIKSNNILRNMIIGGVENTALRMIFEFVGGSRNRNCFRELFNRWIEYPAELRRDDSEALLWGESGLLPDLAVVKMSPETKKFATAVWNRWWLLRHSGRDPVKWRRGNSRPQNSPERRIAAIVMLLKRFGDKPLTSIAEKIVNRDDPSGFVKDLIESMVCRNPLWDNFTNFTCERSRPSAVLGRDAVMEVVVNVLLPALYAAAKISPDGIFKGLDIFAEAAWQSVPKTQDNRIVSNAAAKWFTDKAEFNKTADSAAARQGVIHLYRQYCEKCCFNCSACLIYNSI